MKPKAIKGTTVVKVRALKPGDKTGYLRLRNEATPLPARKKDTPYRYAMKTGSKRKTA